MKIMMQLRPGEGGEDARQLVHEQARIFIRYAERSFL